MIEANLTGARLEKVVLLKTDLTGADLPGTELKKAKSIRQAKFCKTKTPYGLDNTGCKKK